MKGRYSRERDLKLGWMHDISQVPTMSNPAHISMYSRGPV